MTVFQPLSATKNDLVPLLPHRDLSSDPSLCQLFWLIVERSTIRAGISILSDSLNTETLQTCLAGIPRVSRSTSIYQGSVCQALFQALEVNYV